MLPRAFLDVEVQPLLDAHAAMQTGAAGFVIRPLLDRHWRLLRRDLLALERLMLHELPAPHAMFSARLPCERIIIASRSHSGAVVSGLPFV